MVIISGPGSFAVQLLGDHLQSGIICGPGIFCGPVQNPSLELRSERIYDVRVAQFVLKIKKIPLIISELDI